MSILKIILQLLTGALGSLAAVTSILLFIRLRWPSPALWFAKLYVSAFSHGLVILGMMSLVVGFITSSNFNSAIGLYVIIVYLVHIFRVVLPPNEHSGFSQAFGKTWESKISKEQKKNFLRTRLQFILPQAPEPRVERDIAFATLANTNRTLLCDVWQPSNDVSPSGLAFIYLHGSAWYLLDKDFGTRPFFKHLTAQGHVVMDVAYRLYPETDMLGMIQDVKRAIVWMKEHAIQYHVNPDCIVIGGGSAGAHLALMAAYTINDETFNSRDLAIKDNSVCAVVSFYGPSDLETMYFHTNQHLTTREIPGRPKKKVPTEMPARIKKVMGKEFYRLGFDKNFEHAGAIAYMLGGHPDECPEVYKEFSPLYHVNKHCPPTLLIHGAHDIMAPVKSTYELYDRLTYVGVPAVLHIFPQTDHAFDLQLPNLSVSTHNAWYDVERFLALQAIPMKSYARVKQENEAYELNF